MRKRVGRGEGATGGRQMGLKRGGKGAGGEGGSRGDGERDN